MAIIQRWVAQVSGNDAGAGTQGDPYLTVQNALDDLGAADGIQIITKEPATWTVPLNLNSSGNNPAGSNRIVFTNWPDEPRPYALLDNIPFHDDDTMDNWMLCNWDIESQTYTGNIIGAGNNTDYVHIYGCSIVGDGNQAGINVGLQGSIERCYLSNFGTSQMLPLTDTSGNVLWCYIDKPTSTNHVITTATASVAVGNIIHVDNDQDGIRIGNNQAKASGNIVYHSGTSTKRGITTIGIESNTSANDNYVEGFDSNYDMNNTRLWSFQNNVSCDAGTNHYVNLDGIVQDTSNLELTASESWIRLDADGLIQLEPNRAMQQFGWPGINHPGLVLAQRIKAEQNRIRQGVS